jgi:hypothetical protein
LVVGEHSWEEYCPSRQVVHGVQIVSVVAPQALEAYEAPTQFEHPVHTALE